MLAKTYRITSDGDFKKIFSSGRNFGGDVLMLKVMKTSRPVARFAFVVSTKISKRATVRNLIKRRMRAVVQKNISLFIVGVDVVVMAKVKAVGMSYVELEKGMMQMFGKVGLLR